MSATFKSNLGQVKSQYESNVQRCLTAMQLKATEITVMNINASGRIDTGRMAGSVGNEQVSDRAFLHGGEVDYFIFQEMGTRFIAPGNFIRNNFNEQKDEYKNIAEQTLGEGF